MSLQANHSKIKGFSILLLAVMLALVLLMTTCLREDQLNHPFVITGEVTDISEIGVMMHGKVSAPDFSKIQDHGFVWSKSGLPTVTGHNKKSLGKPVSEVFSEHITSGLQSDIEYLARAYAFDGINYYYGRTVSFTSLGGGPVLLTGFYPAAATWKDTLSISGSNFSQIKAENRVFFGAKESLIISASDTLIQTIVPSKLDSISSTITVITFRDTIVAEQLFTLLPHVISEFYPASASWGDTISILGYHFSVINDETTVLFGNRQSQVISVSDSLIRAIVPEDLDLALCPLSVTVFGNKTVAEELFSLLAPVISDFEPKQALIGSTMVISGNYFRDKHTDVYFGDKTATITKVTPKEIICEIPTWEIAEDIKFRVQVYGQSTIAEESFRFLVPSVKSLSKYTGLWNDEITVYGEYFLPAFGQNTVYFNNNIAQVLIVSEDSIVVRVPNMLKEKTSYVSVNTRGSKYTHNSPFQLLDHRILSFEPNEGTFLDIVDIYVENAHPDMSRNKVFFENREATYVSQNENMIRVKVPDILTKSENSIRLVIDNRPVFADGTFNLLPHTIESFTPQAGSFGRGVTIIGSGFSPQKSGNSVRLGNYTINEIINNNTTYFYFQIPWPLGHGEKSVKVKVADREVTADVSFMVYEPWSSLKHIPIGGRISPFSFQLDGRYFAGGGEGTNYYNRVELWEYFPLSDQWSRRADIPEGIGKYSTSFSTDTKGYVLYMKKLFQYDPESNSWLRKADFPGEANYGQVSFVIENKAYVGTGGVVSNYPSTVEFYEYDESTDTWRRIQNFKGPALTEAVGFSIDGKGYVMFGRGWSSHQTFSEFDPETETWTLFNPVGNPGNRNSSMVFIIDGKAIIAGGYPTNDWTELKQVFMFDPAIKRIYRLTDMPHGRARSIVFSHQKKGYLGFGGSNYSPGTNFIEFNLERIPPLD